MISPRRGTKHGSAGAASVPAVLLGAFGIFALGAWAGWAASLYWFLDNDASFVAGVDSAKDRALTPSKPAPSSGPSVWEDLTSSLNSKRLKGIASKLAPEYKFADPFPHAVIDDLFPPSVINALLEEIPESIVKPNGCHPDHHNCQGSKPTNYQYKKSSINKEEHLGPNTRQVLLYMMSDVFLEFLKELSGIRGLLADPQMGGAGVHLTAPGGKLDVHADYNAYPGPKLDRRVNVFLFLNPNWPDEFGGHLELWNREVTQCSQRILPKLGRVVVFSTSDFSHHGHPVPLTAPPGRIRRSLALYYYTVGRPKAECYEGICPIYAPPEGEGHVQHMHSTLWKKPVGCKECLECPSEGLRQQMAQKDTIRGK